MPLYRIDNFKYIIFSTNYLLLFSKSNKNAQAEKMAFSSPLALYSSLDCFPNIFQKPKT